MRQGIVPKEITSESLPTLTWYHGTDLENADSIEQNGLQIGTLGLGKNAVWLSKKNIKWGEVVFKVQLVKDLFLLVSAEHGEDSTMPYNLRYRAIYYPREKWLAIEDLSLIKSIKRL